MKQKFNKIPLSSAEQANLLIERGLIVDDKDKLIAFLENVSYYRLSAYLYPFKQSNSDNFIADTLFIDIYKRYTFDRQIRLLTLDALERVEIAIKSRIVNVFCNSHGAFGYLDIKNFNNFDTKSHSKFLKTIDEAKSKTKEEFVKHFQNKYSDDDLPLWMATEIITFGTMFTMFKNMNRNEKKIIADSFELPITILESWLQTLNSIRNTCAHHARLWNKRLGEIPKIPKNNKNWSNIDNRRLFFILLILSYLLKYCANTTKWHNRIELLIQEHSDLPLDKIGFISNWEQNPIWRG